MNEPLKKEDEKEITEALGRVRRMSWKVDNIKRQLDELEKYFATILKNHT